MDTSNYIYWIWRDLSIIKHLLASVSVVFSVICLVFLGINKNTLEARTYRILNIFIWTVLMFCVFYFLCTLYLSIRLFF